MTHMKSFEFAVLIEFNFPISYLTSQGKMTFRGFNAANEQSRVIFSSESCISRVCVSPVFGLV